MEIRKEGNVWVIPDNCIIYMADVGGISINEYARRHGKSRDAVAKSVACGEYPIGEKKTKKGAVEILLPVMIADHLKKAGHNVIFLV